MSSMSRVIIGLTREVGRPLSYRHAKPIRKLICNLRLLILEVRYVRATIRSRRDCGGSGRISIYDWGARHISDRNAVVEGDEEGVSVSAKSYLQTCTDSKGIVVQFSENSRSSKGIRNQDSKMVRASEEPWRKGILRACVPVLALCSEHINNRAHCNLLATNREYDNHQERDDSHRS